MKHATNEAPLPFKTLVAELRRWGSFKVGEVPPAPDNNWGPPLTNLLNEAADAISGAKLAVEPESAHLRWILGIMSFEASADGTPFPDLTVTKGDVQRFSPQAIDAICSVYEKTVESWIEGSKK
jgi:hypothetical protein